MKRLASHILAVCVAAAGAAWLIAVPQAAARQSGTTGAGRAGDPLLEFPHYERLAREEQRVYLSLRRLTALLETSPDTLETLEALLSISFGRREQAEDALRVARAVLERHPEQTAKVVEALDQHQFAFSRDAARDYRPKLRELLEVARAKTGTVPREEAAALAYQLIRMNGWVNREKNTKEALAAFAREHAGTESALRAEFDLLELSSREGVRYDARARADAFAKFAAEHAGTCAAVAALRAEAVDVGTNMGTGGRTAGQDPTERTLRVLAIARQLDSDVYKRCAASYGAERSVAGHIFASKPTYAPGNADRLIAAYREYVEPRLESLTGDPSDGLGYIIVSRIGDLFKAKGEGLESLDRFLADLEQRAAEPGAVRYLRAVIHGPFAGGSGSDTATAPSDKTVSLLTDLHRTGSGLYARKALASLAWLYHYYGDVPRARQHYGAYIKQYPESEYAWLAAFRLAQCAEESRDWTAAVAEFRAAATVQGAPSFAGVLSHAYAGRALDALGDFEQAAGEYRQAIKGWDADWRERLQLALPQRPGTPLSADPFRDFARTGITLAELEGRLAELTRTLASPGGAVLEQGRWLLSKERWPEAAAVLTGFARRFPGSANVAEAQFLAHRGLLYHALEMLNVEAAEPNVTAGIDALDALAREPYDFTVTAAKIAKACVLWTQGRRADAERLLGDALKERLSRQEWREPASPLERDIADIRSLLFLPTGGQIYSGGIRGWNAFSWPATSPPFVTVPASVRVKAANGRTQVLSLPQRLPRLDNALVLAAEHLEFLSDLMAKIGGTRTRAPRAIMETPNQPVGGSLALMALLDKFFPVRPGHWGGWEFLTYPVITEIEFMDEARTRARAKVTIGYSGCDVLLEKVDGTWKAVSMTNMWVT